MVTGIVDFHSHILPGMDDGSSCPEESLEMLRSMRQQGVTRVAATPHFYPREEHPESFLQRRSEAMLRLRQALPDRDDSEVLLGAEISYFEGLRNCLALKSLVLEKAGVFLVEMPFDRWVERMISDVLLLADRIGSTPMLAHIDRYPLHRAEMNWLLDYVRNGGAIQANADSFLHWKTARRSFHLLQQGMIHVLGSDAHNMTSRPPRIGSAFDRIMSREGNAVVNTILLHQDDCFSECP